MKKILLSIFILCLIAGVLFGGYSIYTAKDRKPTQYIKNEKPQEQSNTKYTATYAKETCYSGDVKLSNIMFAVPFQKTQNYTTNLEFISKYGEETASLFVDKASWVLELFFNTPYYDQTDEKIGELAQLFIQDYCLTKLEDESLITKNNLETIKFYSDWFKDSKTVLETKITTDKSMVFSDNDIVYVRCYAIITPISCNDIISLCSLLGLDTIELGKSYVIMFDIPFISTYLDSFKVGPLNYDDFKNLYRCNGINVVDYISYQNSIDTPHDYCN